MLLDFNDTMVSNCVGLYVQQLNHMNYIIWVHKNKRTVKNLNWNKPRNESYNGGVC